MREGNIGCVGTSLSVRQDTGVLSQVKVTVFVFFGKHFTSQTLTSLGGEDVFCLRKRMEVQKNQKEMQRLARLVLVIDKKVTRPPTSFAFGGKGFALVFMSCV